MKTKFVTVIVFSILCLSHVKSQDLGFYFMDNIYQSNQLNPSKRNQARFHLGLSSLGVGVGHNLPVLSDFSYSKSNPKIDINAGLKKIQPTSLFGAEFQYDLLSLGLQFKKLQIGVAYSFKSDVSTRFPAELPKMAFEGNTQYIGKKVDVGIGADVTLYNELSFQASYPINKKLSIGARGRIINGLANLSTTKSTLNLYTDPDYYQVTANSDYQVNSAGKALTSKIITTPDHAEFVLELSDSLQIKDLFSFSNNRGFGFDIGATYKVNDKIEVAFSALNLGSINWEDNVNNHKSKGTYTFDGIQINDLFLNEDSLNFQGVVDTMIQVLGFTSSQEVYSTSLHPEFYLSGTYNISPSLELGVLLYGKKYNNYFSQAVALSIQKKFGRILSLGAVYSIQNKTYDNLGVNLGVTLGPIQLFAATDNLLTAFKLENAKVLNARFGLNVAIKQNKRASKTLLVD